ncbi:hypothetical protein B0T16DRAFT_514562 [Cercophora newfieldiana]|uniref:NmrA-like domain-containing protein n=1 Tax=Cercophora newfieldiana TaxID=92897 RepID=A0AA40CIZ4_9PEZI|nr:hypothetical protein B0T16DRAFT_514562 [Cercophora newfieldiana]
MPPKPTVFVTSATGCMGSSLARQLLSLGTYNVVFTTRNPSSPATTSLVSLGATAFPASWDDTPGLTTALQGCTHLFLNTFPSLTDPNQELTQAKEILRIAKQAGVTHVVSSGVLPTHTLPQWDPTSWTAPIRLAKQGVETAVRESGIPHWTLLQPGFFMANFVDGRKLGFQFPGASETGVFIHANGAGEVYPLIDEEDIGKFVIKAFEEPERFDGKVVAFASEALSAGEVMEVLRRVSGRDVKGGWVSDEEREREEGMVRMQLENQVAIKGMAGLVDWEAVKGWGVELGTFEGYLGRHRKELDETYAKVKRVE